MNQAAAQLSPVFNPEILLVPADKKMMQQIVSGEVSFIPQITGIDVSGYTGPVLFLDKSTPNKPAFIGVAEVKEVREITMSELSTYHAVRPNEQQFASIGVILAPSSAKEFTKPVLINEVAAKNLRDNNFARLPIEKVVAHGLRTDDAPAAVMTPPPERPIARLQPVSVEAKPL